MARNQKLAVYSGPGYEYTRGAKGKAMVSTNDWVLCYGLCGDWYLVEYEVSRSRNRRGYVNRYEINGRDRMNDTPLPDAALEVTLSRKVSLTDDPQQSREALATVKADTRATLHFFDGDWACVSVKTGSSWAQGYVPASALELDAGR